MPEALSDAPAWLWPVLTFLFAGGGWKLGLWMAEKKLAEKFEPKDQDNRVIRQEDVGDFAQDEDLRALRREVELYTKALDDYATRAELDNVGSRVNAAVDVLATTRDRADTTADAVIRIQEALQLRWQPVAEMLARIDTRLNQHEQAITKATTVLEAMEKRMDRHETQGGR